MSWVTAAMLAGYIGICEYRAPTPWVACESRWNWALGVLVPTPIQGAVNRFLPGRRRRSDAIPDEPRP
jgi:hypothetical protein